MKLKQLESLLGDVQQFDNPKIELEQYPTGPHIASRMLYEIHSRFDEVEGRSVLDLGCGCGTLGIAAAMLGAEHVVGVDADEAAIATAQANCQEYEIDMDFIQARLPHMPLTSDSVEVVVMNPPFGTRTKGADMLFLAAGLKAASVAVYSLHKSSTREHVQRAAVRDFGAKNAEVLYQLRYNLPAMYKFHKRKEVDIEVDLWRFVP
ncbi:hypothetical protein CLOM_g2850 [Closterium sp. NIES-68]|nr:hypothetical protein CLOM_g2850 [Closterium sp. NIES-68]GJP74799.1 hypothetical protein CLOP_g5334 [Closterium sp. NIES-67]GJP81577.1 hypothetical protein CLOP_g11723 [Closterium sp. NIES-67]